ncbi:hypothetical protein [Polaribacter sp.]|uniref:hypothetical protein n=1 Tax=Polaribacter sp. TaxID=1920175 RepID=UPI003EF7A5C5
MKNTSKKILVVVFMLGTLINYASEHKTSLDDAKKIRVEFNFVKKGQNLTIKNYDGTTIYNQEISNSGKYSRVFNLAALENGTYTAELNKTFEVIVKPFIVKEGSISFLENEEYTIYKPLIRFEKNRLFISKMNTSKEPIVVTLYYNNEVIFSEKFKDEVLFEKVLRMKKNKKGTYRAVINSNNNSYVKEFIIK